MGQLIFLKAARRQDYCHETTKLAEFTSAPGTALSTPLELTMVIASLALKEPIAPVVPLTVASQVLDTEV
jgi:hypothetical protein